MSSPMDQTDINAIQLLVNMHLPVGNLALSRLLNEVARLQSSIADCQTTIESMIKTSHWQLERIKHLEAEMDKAPALIAEVASLRSMLGRAGEVIEPFAKRYDELQERIRVAIEERPEITANEVMALENHKAQYAYAKQVLSEIRGVSGEQA